MELFQLSPAKNSRKNRKRKGRGVGSGNGKTAGRGTKGQKCRSGGKVRRGFEGGQMPIHRRLPKRGFTNIFKKQVAIINIRDLERFKDYEGIIDQNALINNGLVKGKWDSIKILAKGEIDYPLNIRINSISKQAKIKIESAGGKVEVL